MDGSGDVALDDGLGGVCIGNHYNLKTTDRTRERHKLYICYDTYTHVITQTY